VNLPARSPRRLYSVMPCASTRIVDPSFAFDAARTTSAAASPPLAEAVDELVVADAPLELFELLPQPASRAAAPSTAIGNFVDVRMFSMSRLLAASGRRGSCSS